MTKWSRFAAGRAPWDHFLRGDTDDADADAVQPDGDAAADEAQRSRTRTLLLATPKYGGGTHLIDDYKVADCAFWAGKLRHPEPPH